MKPRILLVGHLPPAAGGITSLLLSILNSPITEVYELIPFNIGRPAKRHVSNNFGYQALTNSGLRRGLLAVALTLWHMITFPIAVLWYRPALAHIHTAPFLVFWETTYYVLVARLFGLPCALQLHFCFRYFYEASPEWVRPAILWVIQRATVFVVICKEDLQFIAAESGADSKTVYLANFIDISGFSTSVNKARAQSEKGEEIVVFFLGGSDSLRKGFLDLLSAIQRLTATESKLKFLFAAVPSDKVATELPASLLSKCEVEGWVSGDTKVQLFAKSDIFVLPSHAEGMPIAILEAMASAIPVIATRVGGIPDMIADREQGLLVNTENPTELAVAISQLAQDQRMRDEMGKSGLKKALHFFDVPTGIRQLGNLYRETLDSSLSCHPVSDHDDQERDVLHI